MQDYFSLLERAMAQLGIAQNQIGSVRFYEFPDLPTTLANNTDSQPVSVTLQRASILLAIHGQPSLAATLADYAGVSLGVRFPGGFQLVTDGKSPSFAPMLLLFGRESQSYIEMVPSVLLEAGTNVSITYRNASGGAVLPKAALRVVELVK